MANESVSSIFWLYLKADFSGFNSGDRVLTLTMTHGLMGPLAVCNTSLNLSHQGVCFLFKVIKLLGTEKGKKNKTNLVFLAGNRVLKSVERSHSIEKALTLLLK